MSDYLTGELMFNPTGRSDIEARKAEMQSGQVNDGEPQPQPNQGSMPNRMEEAMPSSEPAGPVQPEPAVAGAPNTKSKDKEPEEPVSLLGTDEQWEETVVQHDDKLRQKWMTQNDTEYWADYRERTKPIDEEYKGKLGKLRQVGDWLYDTGRDAVWRTFNPMQAPTNIGSWSFKESIEAKTEKMKEAQADFKKAMKDAPYIVSGVKTFLGSDEWKREQSQAKAMFAGKPDEYEKWQKRRLGEVVQTNMGYDPKTGKPVDSWANFARRGLDLATGGALNTTILTPAQLHEDMIKAGNMPSPTQNAVTNIVNSFSRTTSEFAPGILRGAGSLFDQIDGREEKGQLRLAADYIDAKLKAMHPEDPGRVDEYLTVMSAAGGSITGYIITGALTGGAGNAVRATAMGTQGALMNMGEEYEKAVEAGANDAQKWLSLVFGAGIGATEAIPIEKWLGRMNYLSGGKVRKIIKDGVHGSLEEMLQEVVQTVGNDALGTFAGYDPDALGKGTLTRAIQSAGIAAVTGGAFSGGISAFGVYAGTEPKVSADSLVRQMQLGELEPELQAAIEAGQTPYIAEKQQKVDEAEARFNQLFPDAANTTVEDTDATSAVPTDPLATPLDQGPEVDPVTGESSPAMPPQIIEAAIESAGTDGVVTAPPELTQKNIKNVQMWREKKAKDPTNYTGMPKNERIEIQPPQGSNLPPVVIGQVTTQDWKARTEALLAPEEIQTYAKWYEDVRNVFRENIPDPNVADMFMAAWLAANQNVSVQGALNNVLMQAEQYARNVAPEAMRAGGLPGATNAARNLLTGGTVTEGIGKKIFDFIDSAMGKQSRAWMGEDAEVGGSPFVVDIHTARDTGLVDQIFINHLMRAGYQVPDGLKLDHGGTPSEAQYEDRAQFGRELTAELNAENWMGRSDWKPHEVQAVGWMAMLKLTRDSDTANDTSMSAWELNRRNISFEAKPGTGTTWEKKFGNRFSTLDGATQQQINDVVTQRAWEIASDIAGITIDYGTINAKGGYMQDVNPSTVAQTASTAEAAEIAQGILGYILQQDQVWSNKLKPFTKNPKAIAADLIPQVDGFDQQQLQEAFNIAMEQGPKVKGQPLIVGFQPVMGANGKNGIRILFPGGKKAVERVREFIEKELPGLLPDGLGIRTAEAEVNIQGNNWEEDPEGNGYISGLIQKLGRDPRPELDSARAELEKLFEQQLEGGTPQGIAGSAAPRGTARATGTPPVIREDGKVELTHWSDTEINTLDPAVAHALADPRKTPQAQYRDHPDYVPRVYFGLQATSYTSMPANVLKQRKAMIDRGEQIPGYSKEGILGNIRHTVAIDPTTLYNWAEDPMGFSGMATKEGQDAVYEVERMIHEAGYAGIWYPSSQLGQAAILFGKHDVESIYREPAKRKNQSTPGQGEWLKEPPAGTPVSQNFAEPARSRPQDVNPATEGVSDAFGKRGTPQQTLNANGNPLPQGPKRTGENQQDPRMPLVLPGDLSRPAGGIAADPNADPVRMNSMRIVKALMKIFPDQTFRQGIRRDGHNQSLGIFDNAQGNLRVQNMNDVEVIIHELGHKIHREFSKKNTKVRDWMIKYHMDLRGIADQTYQADVSQDKQVQLMEGFAEFFRLWATNPGYMVKELGLDPLVIGEFENSLDPKVFEGMTAVREMYQETMKMPSQDAIKSMMKSSRKLGIFEASGQLIKEQGLREAISMGMDRVAYNMGHLYDETVSENSPMARLIAQMQNVSKEWTGEFKTLNRADDPYVTMRLMQNVHNKSLLEIKNGQTGYRSTDIVSEGLSQVLATIHGDREMKGSGFMSLLPGQTKLEFDQNVVDDFGAYAASLRVIEEFKRYDNDELRTGPLGRKITEGDALKTIEEMEAKYGDDFIDGFNMLVRYQKALLTKMRDGNLIEEDYYQELMNMENYVPLMRDLSDKQNFMLPPSLQESGLAKIRNFQGSGRDFFNPLETIMIRTFAVNMAIQRNDVMLQLEAFADRTGYAAGNLVEKVAATDTRVQRYNAREVVQQLKKQIGDPDMTDQDAFDLWSTLDGLLDNHQDVNLYRRVETQPNGENLMLYWKDGQRVAMVLKDGELGRDVAEIIKFAGSDTLPPVLDFVATGPAVVVRAGITKWFDFIFMNYLKDQLSAWMQSDVGYIPYIDGLRGVWEELKQGDVARKANMSGMSFGGAQTAALSTARMEHDIEALRSQGYVAEIFSSGRKSNAASNFVRGFAKGTEVTETGTRLGLWRKYYKRALAEGLSDYEAAVEASYEATDYIDFGRTGGNAPMNVVRRTIPFLNAQIQGLDKMFRTMGADEYAQVVGTREALKAVLQFHKDPSAFTADRTMQRALRRGRGAMVKFAALGLAGAMLAMAFKDNREWQEMSDEMKMRYWIIPYAPGHVFLLPKPFEYAALSNIFEVGIMQYYNEVEKDRNVFTETLYNSIPPFVPSVLEIPSELMHNVDSFTGRQISPYYMQSLPPWLRYNQYTSELAKGIARITGWDAFKVDHFLNAFGTSASRDVNFMINNMTREDGRTNDITDMPILRRLFKKTNRGNQVINDFWDQMSSMNGKLRQAETGYNKLLNKEQNPVLAEIFLDELKNDNERAYALLNVHQDVSAKRLHPLRRAKDISQIASGMTREIASSIGLMRAEDGEPITLTPNQKAILEDALKDYAIREVRNSMIFMKEPGWAGKATVDPEYTLRIIEDLNPQVYDELIYRLQKKKVYTFESVRDLWPDLKERVLEGGADAIVDDLVRGAQPL